MFQSSFELTGYITALCFKLNGRPAEGFQSSFELTGYITPLALESLATQFVFQSSFELTGYITMYGITT